MADAASRASPLPPTSAWRPLAHPVFRALWIASVASNVGTWMQSVGGVWLMASLDASPTAVALMQSATAFPTLLLALPAGALADIVDRRRLLLACQLWMLASAAALGALTLAGLATAPILLGLTFSIGLGAAVNMPVWQAITPELVPRDDLPSAVALGGVGMNIARAIGPALGGLVVAALGPGVVFLINAATFVGVVLVLYRWDRAPRASASPVERWFGAMRAGVRYLRHSPELQIVLVRAGAFIASGTALWALLPVLAKSELGMGAVGYGVLLGCVGAGALTGALLLPRLRRALPIDAIIALASLVFAAVTASLALTRNPVLLGAALWVGGVAWIAALASLNVSAQLSVPAWVQARALGLYLMVFQGGMAIASAGWGRVAEHFGVPKAFLAAGAGLVAVLPLGFFFRLGRAVDRDLGPDLHWPDPALAIEPRDEDGPVLVTVEYRVPKENREAFSAAIGALARVRRRDGAIDWSCYTDTADPERRLEAFLVESWAEHLRQHERMTNADREHEDRVRKLVTIGTEPVVRHFIADAAWKSSS